jgi:hypothetical protein
MVKLKTQTLTGDLILLKCVGRRESEFASSKLIGYGQRAVMSWRLGVLKVEV